MDARPFFAEITDDNGKRTRVPCRYDMVSKMYVPSGGRDTVPCGKKVGTRDKTPQDLQVPPPPFRRLPSPSYSDFSLLRPLVARVPLGVLSRSALLAVGFPLGVCPCVLVVLAALHPSVWHSPAALVGTPPALVADTAPAALNGRPWRSGRRTRPSCAPGRSSSTSARRRRGTSG